MDKIAEKLSLWFGSTPFIIFHIVWMTAWMLVNWSVEILTLVLSVEAIFLSLFILRAENLEGARMERYIKETREVSKQDLDTGKKILKELKNERTN